MKAMEVVKAIFLILAGINGLALIGSIMAGYWLITLISAILMGVFLWLSGKVE